jgi:hypothetical protein
MSTRSPARTWPFNPCTESSDTASARWSPLMRVGIAVVGVSVKSDSASCCPGKMSSTAMRSLIVAGSMTAPSFTSFFGIVVSW